VALVVGAGVGVAAFCGRVPLSCGEAPLSCVGTRVTVAPAWASRGPSAAAAPAEEPLKTRIASSPRAKAPDLITSHTTGPHRSESGPRPQTTGVQGVLQAVGKEVHADYHDRDREARKQGVPRRTIE